MKIKAIMRKYNCVEGRPTGITGEWKEIDNAIANLHLAQADSILSSVVEKKIVKKIGMLSPNYMSPSHFTTRYS